MIVNSVRTLDDLLLISKADHCHSLNLILILNFTRKAAYKLSG